MSNLKAKDPKAAVPTKPKIVIFGPAGVGKTWWALSGFPAPYYIDSEGGASRAHYTDRLAKAGGSYMGPEDGTQDFNIIIGQLKALATERHRYGTVVIDSITKPFNQAIAAEAERMASAGITNAYGADKKPAVAQVRRLISWIGRIDMNVILIAHEKPQWGLNQSGERVQLGVTFDCYDKLDYELDLCIQVAKRGASRVGIVRKSRLTGFPDGESFDWSFAEFSARYGKDVIAAKPTTIVLAGADAIAEINRLVALMKLTPEEIGKALAKDGVETIADLSADQAANWLKRLNKAIGK